MTNQLLDKFVALEKEISKEKGPFTLFAALMREELEDLTSTSSGPTATPAVAILPGRWDLVASAHWIYEDKKRNFSYFAQKLREHFGRESLLTISRIVLLRPDEPVVQAFNSAFRVQNKPVEITQRHVYNLSIRRGFIIKSQYRVAATKSPS